MSRQTSTTCSSSPCGPRIGEACTSSQATEPSGVRRSQMRTCRSPEPRQASVGQSPRAQRRRHVAAGAAEHLLADTARALQEGVVGGDDLALRVEHDDAVVDAVDDRLQPLALAAHLADQAGDRIGHRVELAGQPGDRVGALRRHAPVEVARGDQPRGRLEALQAPQHEHADHEREQRRSAAGRAPRCPRPSSAGRGSSSARMPPASRSRIRMPLMRCAGSWQRWQASRLRIGITVRRIVASPRFDHAARAALLGREAVAGLAGRRAQVELARVADRGARVAGDAGAVEQHHAAPRAAPSRSSRSSARSGCGRSRSSGARAPRGSARPARGRSPARRLEQRPEVVGGVEVRPGGAGDRDRGGDARRRARPSCSSKRSLIAGARGRPRRWWQTLPSGVNA